MNNKKIFVTKPTLPPLEDFINSLGIIWNNGILTNNGPFHEEFEKKLAEYLGVKYISLFTNGTLALITALQALRITGEVITTPYSFVATTHSLWWNNIKPVFADIELETFNLDPSKVEAAITPKTTAILPVHVYGNPCEVNELQRIADTYGLRLIYDAAHAFGVKLNGQSILNFGDLSILSFHATKVFNTIEGGAIVSHSENTKKRIDYLKNFGFTGETSVIEPGINAKMNEIQSAYGILQLKYVDENIKLRAELTKVYRDSLSNVAGISFIDEIPNVVHNYSYFPILVDPEIYKKTRDDVYNQLKESNIYCRRYFYPLISNFPTYKGLLSADSKNLPNAELVSQQVLCLPIYPGLSKDEQNEIVSLILC